MGKVKANFKAGDKKSNNRPVNLSVLTIFYLENSIKNMRLIIVERNCEGNPKLQTKFVHHRLK